MAEQNGTNGGSVRIPRWVFDGILVVILGFMSWFLKSAFADVQLANDTSKKNAYEIEVLQKQFDKMDGKLDKILYAVKSN